MSDKAHGASTNRVTDTFGRAVVKVPLDNDLISETDGNIPVTRDARLNWIFDIRQTLKEESVARCNSLSERGKIAVASKNREAALGCYRDQLLEAHKLIEHDLFLIGLRDQAAERNKLSDERKEQAERIVLLNVTTGSVELGSQWDSWKEAHRRKKTIAVAEVKEEPKAEKSSNQNIEDEDILINMSTSDIENALSVVPMLKMIDLCLYSVGNDRSPEFLFHDYIADVIRKTMGALRHVGLLMAPLKGPIIRVNGVDYHLVQIQKRLHSNVQNAHLFTMQMYVHTGSSLMYLDSSCPAEFAASASLLLRRHWELIPKRSAFDSYRGDCSPFSFCRLFGPTIISYDIQLPWSRIREVRARFDAAVGVLPSVIGSEIASYLFCEQNAQYFRDSGTETDAATFMRDRDDAVESEERFERMFGGF